MGSTGAVMRAYYNEWDDYDISAKADAWIVPREVAARTAPHLMRCGRVLDAGCGTGLLGRQLRKAGYRGELIGVDVAEKRLSEARHRRFGRGTVYSGVRRADLYRLPWREPVFDAVLTSGVLGLIGSRAVDELFRVLKPGGVFGVSVCYLNTKRSKLQYIAILYRLGALVNAGRLKPLSAWDLGTGYEGQKNSEHHDLIVYRKAA